MATAKLIYDSSKNADLYYATRFSCHDPFIFIEWKKKTYLVMSDLEYDRAKLNAQVDKVLALRNYQSADAKQGIAAAIHAVLQELKIKKVVMPASSSFKLVDELRKFGYKITVGSIPFYPERYQKSSAEKKWIHQSQRATFSAFKMAEEVLRSSKIKNGRIVYKGQALSSEKLRAMISVHLLERGYLITDEPIVAGGKQGCDPHERGHGVLKANQSIIIDVFPTSLKTGYCGDVTRTYCKGQAPDSLKKLYSTVKQGQKLGFEMIKAGVNGKKIHNAIKSMFTKAGYPTGEKAGRMQGFFHGTGHGIGLEVHEEPARISARDFKLQAGNVVTVEPGLYYTDIGAVRIEDIVYVAKSGCELLGGRYPRRLEIK